MKPSLVELAKEKVLVYDGAMGTTLFSYDLSAEDYGGKDLEGCPENLNKTKPEMIQEIHTKFFEAGADIVETNSFGSSKLVLGEYGLEAESYDISKLSATLAKEVADKFTEKEPAKPRYIAGSIGPGTKLPSLGNITFDILKESYKPQVAGLIDGGVDVILIETCQDPLQIKAVLAAAFEVFKEIEEKFKDKSDEELLKAYPAAVLLKDSEKRVGLSTRIKFPLQVQITIEQMGTMLVGSDSYSALTTISAYPVDAFGMNCATGPKEMQEHLQSISESSPFMLSCLPNAGIPENVCGHAHFPLKPDEFAEYMNKFIRKYNIRLVGGCCGTNYEHISKLAAIVNKINEEKLIYDPLKVLKEVEDSVSSIYSSVFMDMETKPLIVGERTNANGSKKFRELLAAEDYEAITELAKEQVEEGAQILDLCAAYVGRDEIRDMKEIISKLNTSVNIPIMVDSTEAPVIEESLKLISGKAVINSVNLEDGEKRVELIASLCNIYGAALVALTIDEDGMAKTAEKKVAIAKRLYKLLVNKHGMSPQDIIFDTLTFTLGSGDEEFRKAGIETIEAIKLIKAELPHVKTILGVSNISFGLDARLRPALNSVFMHEAVKAGLDMAIVNNKKILPMHKIDENLKKLCLDLVYDKREYKSIKHA